MDSSIIGYVVIIIIAAFVSPFIFATEHPQRNPEEEDIELGEFPSFVNPDLAQERLSIPIPPNIDFPPATHTRP